MYRFFRRMPTPTRVRLSPVPNGSLWWAGRPCQITLWVRSCSLSSYDWIAFVAFCETMIGRTFVSNGMDFWQTTWEGMSFPMQTSLPTTTAREMRPWLNDVFWKAQLEDYLPFIDSVSIFNKYSVRAAGNLALEIKFQAVETRFQALN